MRKFFAVIACILLAGAGNAYAEDIKVEYEKLKKEYAKVLADRDNILLQSKNMLECNQRFMELDAKYKKAQQENDELKKNLQRTQDELALISQSASELKAQGEEKTRELEDKANQLVQENGKLKNSLEQVEIEYKIVPETKREIARLQSERKELVKKNNQLDARLKTLESQRIDKDAQIEIYRKQVISFKKRYEQAMAKNRVFEKKVDQLPVKFAEMARENKVLIKETALMHYNLGVFYTKSKEYSRAVAEFEKAIELNSDDPYAYYNLGYIYAEYLVNRPKAIANFKKYLNLLKTDDKDSDWVKKYIVTWQTWEGKQPAQ